MGFTDPITFVANDRLTKQQLVAALQDNMNALKNPPTALFVSSGYAADISTTSTSFTDVDATNLALTIVTTGNGNGGPADIMIGFSGTAYSSASIRIYFRLMVDGVAIDADDGLFLSEASDERPVGFLRLHPNVAAGSHTVKLQWKVSSGTGVLLSHAGTSTRDCSFQFWAREVS
jgi:hypothetical protein